MPRPAETDPGLTERRQSPVGILYLSEVPFPCAFPAVSPASGLFSGILFPPVNISARGKRIGRVCLTPGINAALTVPLMIMVPALGPTGALSDISKD